MVRYKVLATLIISALVLLLPKSASALITVPSTYDSIVSNTWVGGSGFCSANATHTFSNSAYSISSLMPAVADSTCSANASGSIYLKPGEYGVWSFTIRGLGVTSMIQGNLTGNYSIKLIDVKQTVSPTSFVLETNGENFVNPVDINNEFFSSTYQMTFYNPNNFDARIFLGGGDGPLFTFYEYGRTSSATVSIISNYVTIYKPIDSSEQDEYYQQQNEGTSNIEGQDTSGSNQGVSDDNYSSLLDIFSGFITAITNVSGGTCTISLNTDFANLGEVDLCTYDPPSYIQIIGSIILILLFVPLSMALIKRILKTIQELQT